MPTTSPPPVERTIPPALVTRLGNPVLSWLLSRPRRAGKVGQSLLLLHVTGRRTGKVYTTPVAYHRRADGSLLVLTSSGWRVNLRGAPDPCRVSPCSGAEWRPLPCLTRTLSPSPTCTNT